MKVFVNLPQTPEGKELLASGIARFHASLMLEKIKDLYISDSSKEEILKLVLKHLEEEAKKECMKN